MRTNCYFATFPAGCYSILLKRFKSFRVEDLKVIDHDESSLVFVTPYGSEKIIEMRFFTNAYLVLDEIRKAKALLRGNYYRLIGLNNGIPEEIEINKRNEIEGKIESRLRLKANTHLSSNEFCLIKRGRSNEFIGLKLPRAKFKREKLQPGELRPELAHILCLVAGLKAKHNLLDMFAGYGAIPLEGVKGFGCRNVLANDSKILPKRHEHIEIVWFKDDARLLKHIQSSSVDRIITDPPWGVYGDHSDEDMDRIYSALEAEANRILKPGAIIVILTGWPGAEQILTQRLKLLNQWDILVSGKKANIYKLQQV